MSHKITKNILVSIIIPVYNTEKYIEQCINSCLNQTYKNIEIICVNDGSNDSSLETLNKFSKNDNKVIVINQENQGVGFSRNTGIDSAKGEYILFLDSDDFLELDGIEKLIRCGNTKNVNMVIGNYFYYDDLNSIQRENNTQFKSNFYPQELEKTTFTWKDCPDSFFQIFKGRITATLYNREFLIKNNIKFSNLKIGEDIIFKTQALLRPAKIKITKEYIENYRKDRIGNSVEKRIYQTQDILNFHTTLKTIIGNLPEYKLLNKSYYILQFDEFLYNLSLINSKEEYNKLSKFYRETIFPTIGLNDDLAKVLLSENNYKIYNSVIKNLEPAVTIGRLERKIKRIENLKKENERLLSRLREVKTKHSQIKEKLEFSSANNKQLKFLLNTYTNQQLFRLLRKINYFKRQDVLLKEFKKEIDNKHNFG